MYHVVVAFKGKLPYFLKCVNAKLLFSFMNIYIYIGFELLQVLCLGLKLRLHFMHSAISMASRVLYVWA